MNEEEEIDAYLNNPEVKAFTDKGPWHMAYCYICQKLKEKNLDYKQIDQDYMSALIRYSVFRATKQDGSIDPVEFKECLEKDVTRCHAKLSGSKAFRETVASLIGF